MQPREQYSQRSGVENSGGASPPRATTTGGAWVHAPPENRQKNGLALLCFISLSPPCKRWGATSSATTAKTHKQSILDFLFPCFFEICFDFFSSSCPIWLLFLFFSVSDLFLSTNRSAMYFSFFSGGSFAVEDWTLWVRRWRWCCSLWPLALLRRWRRRCWWLGGAPPRWRGSGAGRPKKETVDLRGEAAVSVRCVAEVGPMVLFLRFWLGKGESVGGGLLLWRRRRYKAGRAEMKRLCVTPGCGCWQAGQRRGRRKKIWGGLGGWRLPCEGEEQKLSFSRVFSFLCFWFPFSKITKCPPSLNLLRRPLFIGKMLLGFSTWSLNFYLFVNLIFLNFFVFLKTSNINVDSMRKINDFKNDAWKVERVPKTFEN